MVSKGWDPGIGDMGLRREELHFSVDTDMIKGYNGIWGKEIGRLYSKVEVAMVGLLWPLLNMGKSTQNQGIGLFWHLFTESGKGPIESRFSGIRILRFNVEWGICGSQDIFSDLIISKKIFSFRWVTDGKWMSVLFGILWVTDGKWMSVLWQDGDVHKSNDRKLRFRKSLQDRCWRRNWKARVWGVTMSVYRLYKACVYCFSWGTIDKYEFHLLWEFGDWAGFQYVRSHGPIVCLLRQQEVGD
ncbi:Uncharacterized protein Rs2_03159 [Raphanus sativus]|nr:Uncharacterized protein Rs2_03159 [Raphanus sativus]